MRKLLALSYGLLVAGFVCIAQAQLLQTGAGKVGGGGGGGGGFQGLVDVNPGAFSFFGMRAARASLIAGGGVTKCLQVTFSDSSTKDYFIGTNGHIDLSTLAADLVTHGGPAYISIWYDQIGTNNMPGTAGSGAPVLTTSALGIYPVATFTSATPSSMDRFGATNPPNAYPLLFSVVYENTAAANAGLFAIQAPIIIYAITPNQVQLAAGGTPPTVTAADNVFHAVQGLFNDPSSSLTVDGVTTGGMTAGTNGFGATSNWKIGGDGFGNNLSGAMVELAVYQGTNASGFNLTAGNANQHGTNGYNF